MSLDLDKKMYFLPIIKTDISKIWLWESDWHRDFCTAFAYEEHGFVYLVQIVENESLRVVHSYTFNGFNAYRIKL